MAKIALLCSNNFQIGQNGHKTGASLLELAPIVYELERADHLVEIMSPMGGLVPLDPSTLDFSNPIVRDYHERRTFLQRLESSASFDQVTKERYDAAVVCGGWNGAGEFSTKLSLGDALLKSNVRHIALVGYSTSLLLQPEIASTFKGVKITAPSAQEDQDIGFNKFWPLSLSHDLQNAGYEYLSSKPWSRFVVDGGVLLTGQNVFSAQAVAELLSAKLHLGA